MDMKPRQRMSRQADVHRCKKKIQGLNDGRKLNSEALKQSFCCANFVLRFQNLIRHTYNKVSVPLSGQELNNFPGDAHLQRLGD